MKILTAAALALSAVAAIPAVQAQTATVHFTDLDLESPAGKAELDRRIKVVSRQLCRAEAMTGSNIPNRSAQMRCESEVRSQVMDSIPN